MKLFLATAFVSCFLYACTKRCGVSYLTESDIKDQKEKSIIQDSVLQFNCFSYPNDSTVVTIILQFTTREIYNVDSLDLTVTMDNNEIINLYAFKSLISDNNYVTYYSDSSNINEIIPQLHIDTRKKLTKYCNEYDFCFSFSNYRAIKNKFIIVRIKASLTNDSRVIKYDKKFKLFSREQCYYD